MKKLIYFIIAAAIVASCNNTTDDSNGLTGAGGATGAPGGTGPQCANRLHALEDAVEQLLEENGYVEEDEDRHPCRKANPHAAQQTGENQNTRAGLIQGASAAPPLLTPSCTLGTQYSLTSYKINTITSGGNHKIEVRKKKDNTVLCECTLSTAKIQIKVLPAAGLLPDRFVFQNPVSLSSPTPRDIKQVGTDTIFVDIVKNTFDPNSNFIIVGSDDGRTFNSGEDTATFTYASLKNKLVNLSFKAAGGGQPDRISIEAENSNISLDQDRNKASIMGDTQ